MPLRTTSRPLGGRDAPAGTSSQISYLRRAPRGTSRPLDGREVPGPTPPAQSAGTPPAQSAGGRYPFFKIFPTGTPFANFIFYLFFKKNIHTARLTLGLDPLLGRQTEMMGARVQSRAGSKVGLNGLAGGFGPAGLR
jgi:hypothetical protein